MTDEQVETTPEETEEKPEGEEKPESEETEVEPTAKEAYELAQALQKGYTLTRQDMAAIRENQESIQQSLKSLQTKETNEFGEVEEEPLTVKKFLSLQGEQQKTKEQEADKLNQKVNSQLSELRIQGVIKTDEDEQKLLDFAVKRKMTSLSAAAELYGELQNAKKEGIKEGLKSKVKAEAGSNVGNSQKAGAKEQGFDYGEISSKSMDELAQE